MLIRAIANCDAQTEGGKVALFRGQVYDLPPGVARTLLDGGQADPVGAKSVKGPPSDKAQSIRESTVPKDTKPIRSKRSK